MRDRSATMQDDGAVRPILGARTSLWYSRIGWRSDWRAGVAGNGLPNGPGPTRGAVLF